MKYIVIFIFVFILSCSSNKVVKNHGISLLEKKSEKIFVTKSNKNDIIEILGPPSTKSSFDANTWIYIERKKINQSIFKLGKKKIHKNNVLVVKINNNGLLENKSFYKLDDMNDIEFNKKVTANVYEKDDFVYNFLSSLREKINAPVKKRRKNNKK
tara:strand:- start:424 stop:891 length:468 start_codon:yes stop_codon:yes gene_type:complete